MIKQVELESMDVKELVKLNNAVQKLIKEKEARKLADLEQHYKGKCFYNETSGTYYKVIGKGSTSNDLMTLMYQLDEDLETSYEDMGIVSVVLVKELIPVTWLDNIKEITEDEFKNTFLNYVNNVL